VIGLLAGRERRSPDKHATLLADADVDVSLYLKDVHRFAKRCAGHAQLGGQLPFRGQLGSGLQLAQVDDPSQVIHDDLVR
jgi:hypothetical protein